MTPEDNPRQRSSGQEYVWARTSSLSEPTTRFYEGVVYGLRRSRKHSTPKMTPVPWRDRKEMKQQKKREKGNNSGQTLLDHRGKCRKMIPSPSLERLLGRKWTALKIEKVVPAPGNRDIDRSGRARCRQEVAGVPVHNSEKERETTREARREDSEVVDADEKRSDKKGDNIKGMEVKASFRDYLAYLVVHVRVALATPVLLARSVESMGRTPIKDLAPFGPIRLPTWVARATAPPHGMSWMGEKKIEHIFEYISLVQAAWKK
ncbi:hypothetical protein B0H11DRAFT_1914977 [Mycena galericulata]|nr:hypothetical protein B0H11DRAFT_1914977 [Mycena galericulata]